MKDNKFNFNIDNVLLKANRQVLFNEVKASEAEFSKSQTKFMFSIGIVIIAIALYFIMPIVWWVAAIVGTIILGFAYKKGDYMDFCYNRRELAYIILKKYDELKDKEK